MEGYFHWKVVTSGERLTVGAVDYCFVGGVGDKEMVELEMGSTSFCLQKVGVECVISCFFFPCGCGGEVECGKINR
eukprot:5688028-Ditylum_brightwellii.AAC.1